MAPTVNLEIFAVEIFSLPHKATKIKIVKYFQLWIIKQTKYLHYKILNQVQTKTRGSPSPCNRVSRWRLLSIRFSAISRSIRDYFHIRDGLPDPWESLSSQLPSQAIVLTNKENTLDSFQSKCPTIVYTFLLYSNGVSYWWHCLALFCTSTPLQNLPSRPLCIRGSLEYNSAFWVASPYLFVFTYNIGSVALLSLYWLIGAVPWSGKNFSVKIFL